MGFPLGGNALSTLRATAHWHCDLFEIHGRHDPIPLRLSTLDTLIEFDALDGMGPQVYRPTAGEMTDAEIEAGMAAGDIQIAGALSPDTITQVDIQRGAWDEAEVVHRTVDWRRGKLYAWQNWWVDEITHDGRAWRAILSTSARFLQGKRGDVYHGVCPAILGDDDCRATVPEYTPQTVATVTDARLSFTHTGSMPALPDGRFRRGEVRWLTGNNSGTTNHVVASVSNTSLELAGPTRFRIRVGDTFTARPGCDGLASTCKDVYNNLPNHRGNERQRNSKQLILSRVVTS